MLPVRPPRVSDANPLPDSAAFTVAALRYSFGLRLVKEARPAYRPDAISVRRSSWVMPFTLLSANASQHPPCVGLRPCSVQLVQGLTPIGLRACRAH